MLAYTYLDKGRFGLVEKPVPVLQNDTDAIVRVTLASICTSDLHIKHGFVPRAVRGITVGHEAVGVVEAVGDAVKGVRPGDRVSVGVETFCGLTLIPDGVSDESAVLAGDILATGWWAAKIADIEEGSDTLVIGAGPTGICCALSASLKSPNRVFICDIDDVRLDFVRKHYPSLITLRADEALEKMRAECRFGGADSVIEAAGTPASFRLAWEAARPASTVTVVAMYDEAQTLPLPEMYGKNLTFKTGGVDGCDGEDILAHIAAGKLDTSALITHTFPLSRADEAYKLFEARADGVMKVALNCTR